MRNVIRLLEHLSFRNPEPKTEIHRLVVKHDLALEAIDIKNYPKTIGLRKLTESRCCSLWRTNANSSVRKVKKALKRFLREYDSQHPRMSVMDADNLAAYDKDGNKLNVANMIDEI